MELAWFYALGRGTSEKLRRAERGVPGSGPPPFSVWLEPRTYIRAQPLTDHPPHALARLQNHGRAGGTLAGLPTLNRKGPPTGLVRGPLFFA